MSVRFLSKVRDSSPVTMVKPISDLKKTALARESYGVQNPSLKKANSRSLLPPWLQNLLDMEKVVHISDIFNGRLFHVCNNGPELSKESIHYLIVANGGQYSMNRNKMCTDIVASHNRGFRFKASIATGPVLHHSWIQDCAAALALVEVKEAHLLHLPIPSEKP